MTRKTAAACVGVLALLVWVGSLPYEFAESIAGVVVLAATVAIPVALHRQQAVSLKPWWLIYSAIVLNVVSLLVRVVHASSAGVDYPFPSPADVFAVAGLIATIVGLVLVARSRRAFGGQGDSLDVLVLALAVAGPFWVLVLDSYFRDPSFSVAHRSLTALYALIEVGLVAVVLRLITSAGQRSHAFLTLGVAGVAFAVLDALFILDTTGREVQGLLPVFAIITAASFVYLVSSRELHLVEQRPPATDPRLTTSRLLTISVAFISIPVVLLLEVVSGGDNMGVVLAFVGVQSGLILARTVGLLRGRDRVADLDVSLRDAGRDLIASDSLEEVSAIAHRTISLIGGGDCRAAFVLRGTEKDCKIVAIGATGTSAENRGDWDVEEDEANLLITLEPIEDEGLLTVVPLGSRAQQGSIALLPQRPLANAQQLALQTLGSQLAMALRSLEVRETVFRRRAEQRLRALVEQSADVVVVTDAGTIIFMSPNARRVIGRSPADMIDRHPGELAHPDDRERLERHLARVGPSSDAIPAIEVRLASSDGDYRWFDLTARDFSDDPEVGGVVITARDVTEERAAKLGLLRSEQWFRGLVQNSSDAIAVVDDQGVFTYASPALDRLLGVPSEHIRAHNLLEFLDPTDSDGSRELRQAFSTESSESRTVELRLQRADEEVRIAEVTVTDLRRDPSVQGLVLNIRNITDRKRLENDLRHQVLHDDLTGLGSRVQFTSQLAEALGPKRRAGSKVAALFIDLDDFKNINDSLGHAAGDLVLVEISSRLQGRLRLHDRAARFGGDEFAVLLTDVYGESDVTMVADRIVEELSRPVELMGQEVRLGVSIGIAIDEDGTNSPEDLLRSADVAMYEAKAQGKGRWAMFADEMADQTIERFEITNSLGAAIENDELMVYYQPILDLGSGRTRGVEALVRWKHPIRGMVNPGAFIPLAERNGLIVPLGRRVLEKAVAQVAEWRQAGHDIYASVNISPVQLQLDGIVAEVLEIVDSAGMDRNAVVLELTESALINDFELVVARIDELRAAGIRVAIDDFGTGYATLRYAEEFSADILKIDQTFVARLETQDDSTIVSTVLAIAEGMGAQTVAEGIEVPDQHRRLMALGCHLGQGYYFTRPAPPAVIGELLAHELEGEALVGHAH